MRRLLPNRYYDISTPLIPVSWDQQKALDAFRQSLVAGEYQFESVSCLCGNSEGILIAQRDRYALPVNTYLCRQCGMMWTNPRMRQESLNRFYKQAYRSIYVGQIQASDEFFDTQVEQGQFILDYVSSDIPSRKPLVVFDIGCGAGGMLLPFRDAGWSVYGCDIGGNYLDRGRQAGLVLEHGGSEVLTKYGKADLVILSHVLEHLPDPDTTLQEIADLLVDDGFLYIEVPGIFNIHKTYKDFLLFLQNAHLYHFTLTTLHTLLARNSFQLMKGNEYIHALFQKQNIKSSISIQGLHRQIIGYIYFVELLRLTRMFKKQIFSK